MTSPNEICKKRKEIEEKIFLEEFPKGIPKGMKAKKREELISSSYIIESEDGNNIIISGGYKVFLYMCYIEDGRENMKKDRLKNKSWNQYEELLRILKREKLFGVIGKLEKPNSIDISKVIFEEVKTDG